MSRRDFSAIPSLDVRSDLRKSASTANAPPRVRFASSGAKTWTSVVLPSPSPGLVNATTEGRSDGNRPRTDLANLRQPARPRCSRTSAKSRTATRQGAIRLLRPDRGESELPDLHGLPLTGCGERVRRFPTGISRRSNRQNHRRHVSVNVPRPAWRHVHETTLGEVGQTDVGTRAARSA